MKEYEINRDNGEAQLNALFENHKTESVQISWIEKFSDGRWEITNSENKYVKLDAYRTEFTVKVPANSKKEVSFYAKMEKR